VLVGVDDAIEELVRESAGGARADVFAGAAAAGRAKGDRPARLLLLLHVLVATGLVLELGARAFRARRLIARARPVDSGPAWLQDKGIRLLESEEVQAPSCAGGFPRVILLPKGDATRLDPERLRCVLLHELVHLERRDGLVALLGSLLCILFWFHPGAWLLAALVRRDQESSCDALVVRRTGKPRTYALTLLEYAGRRTVPALVGMAGARARMKRRLTMIEVAQKNVRGRAVGIAGCSLAGVLGLSLALLQGSIAAAGSAFPGPGGPIAVPGSRAPAGGPNVIRIQAPPEGREDETVYRRLTGLRVGGGQLERLRALGYLEQESSGWVTDQETVVSARKARLRGTTLEAREVLLSLPEGSRLTALLEGQQVLLDSRVDGSAIRLVGGALRILDEGGVTRVSVPGDGASVLEIEVKTENGETCMALRGVDGSGKESRVRVILDPDTGRPEDEDRPPHKAVRWALLTPDDSDEDPVRLKMQWIYDLGELGRTVGKKTGGTR
jgi:hypothetical protein